MKKKVLIGLFVLVFMIQLVNAAEVCVIVDYGSGGENKPDSKCIDIDEGKNGYELLNEIGWNIKWKDWGGTLGHSICSINDLGYDESTCWGNEGYWNFNLIENGEWYHVIDKGFDGTPHYETVDGDFVGLAFGPDGAKPEMFKVNITRIYVDGEKQSDSKTRSGKIVDVFPGSVVEFRIELENLYDSGTDIEITDISIEGTIEEINDGEDIDEEISDFDLDADRKKTEELKFEIPLKAEAKDRLVRIEINAKDDAGIKYETEFTYDLEVKKEDHKLKITKAELDKASYKCGENALLSLYVLNIGAKEENVNLKIVNEDLKLEINEAFGLSNDPSEESSKYEKRFNIWLPRNISKVTYPITITANYGAQKETANVNLVVSECEKKTGSTPAEEVEESNTDVGAGQSNQEGGIEAEKETKPGEMTKIAGAGKITENLPFVLIAVLGVLIVLIIALLAIFWVFRR